MKTFNYVTQTVLLDLPPFTTFADIYVCFQSTKRKICTRNLCRRIKPGTLECLTTRCALQKSSLKSSRAAYYGLQDCQPPFSPNSISCPLCAQYNTSSVLTKCIPIFREHYKRNGPLRISCQQRRLHQPIGARIFRYGRNKNIRDPVFATLKHTEIGDLADWGLMMCSRTYALSKCTC